MKLQCYAIYDAAASYYNPPFFVRSRGEAERLFEELANDFKTRIGQHPHDFVLHWLCEWEDQGAMFTQDSPPTSLLSGAAARLRSRVAKPGDVNAKSNGTESQSAE